MVYTICTWGEFGCLGERLDQWTNVSDLPLACLRARRCPLFAACTTARSVAMNVTTSINETNYTRPRSQIFDAIVRVAHEMNLSIGWSNEGPRSFGLRMLRCLLASWIDIAAIRFSTPRIECHARNQVSKTYRIREYAGGSGVCSRWGGGVSLRCTDWAKLLLETLSCHGAYLIRDFSKELSRRRG